MFLLRRHKYIFRQFTHSYNGINFLPKHYKKNVLNNVTVILIYIFIKLFIILLLTDLINLNKSIKIQRHTIIISAFTISSSQN